MLYVQLLKRVNSIKHKFQPSSRSQKQQSMQKFTHDQENYKVRISRYSSFDTKSPDPFVCPGKPQWFHGSLPVVKIMVPRLLVDSILFTVSFSVLN